ARPWELGRGGPVGAAPRAGAAIGSVVRLASRFEGPRRVPFEMIRSRKGWGDRGADLADEADNGFVEIGPASLVIAVIDFVDHGDHPFSIPSGGDAEIGAGDGPRGFELGLLGEVKSVQRSAPGAGRGGLRRGAVFEEQALAQWISHASSSFCRGRASGGRLVR